MKKEIFYDYERRIITAYETKYTEETKSGWFYPLYYENCYDDNKTIVIYTRVVLYDIFYE